MEKAFAKLYGSYKALERVGIDIDIMVDLTGGIVVRSHTGLNMPNKKPDEFGRDLFSQMESASENRYPMTCCTPPCPIRKVAREPGNAGARHFLSVIEVSGVEICVRDPGELLGDSCICLKRLDNVSSKADVRRLQKNLFLDVFDRVQICHIADDKAYPGNDQLISRTWKDELIACGEKSNLTEKYDQLRDMMTLLPQYHIRCTGEDKVSIMFGILQQNLPPQTSFTIHFYGLKLYIYQSGLSSRNNLDSSLTIDDTYKRVNRVEKFSRYHTHREQGGSFVISPGCAYVLVVSPHFGDLHFPFLLRIFASSPNYELQKLGDNGNFEEITTEDRESYDRGHVEDDFAQEMCNPNT